MSIPGCQHIGKLRNECEHAYGSANSYTRRHHEDPDYVDENAWEFIRTFSDQTHKNYLLARHLKATSNGQWKTLQWLMQGDLDAVLDKRMAHKTSGTGVRTARAGECCDDSTRVDKSLFVPLTSYFGPERIEEFVAQKQGTQHLLDFTVKKMKDEKLDVDVHANEIRNIETFPDNDPNRIKYGKKIADMLINDIETFPDNDPNRIKYGKKIADMLKKRALGTTGFARIDDVHASEIKDIETFPDNDPNRIKYGKKFADMLKKRALGTTGFARIDDDLERVGRKRYGLELERTGAKTAKAGEYSDDSTRMDKSTFEPHTSYFGTKRNEEFVTQKQGSLHLLDFAVEKMKDEKLDKYVHAKKIKNIETFPDNDPNRLKYGNTIADMLMKRALGTTGFARIDEDLERPDRKIFGLDLDRTGRVKSMTDYSHRPTAGYYTNYKRNAEKNEMKNYIKTISKFYASVAEPQSIKVDSIERLTQTIEEEFYKTVSYHIPSYGKRDPSKVRLSAVIRKLKSMPGYAAFQAVLYHEPFDRNKPWTWMRTFPKRIPKEYLKRVSENIVNDMKKWKRQQKITALTYSPGKRIIDVAKSKRLQKKRGKRNLKTRNQKEVTDNDVDIVEKQD